MEVDIINMKNMKSLTIENSFIPITEKEIEIFEMNNKVILPNYLRKFFLKYNGSSTKECLYSCYIINSFLPLLKVEHRSSVEDFFPWIRNPEFLIGRYDMIPFTIDPRCRSESGVV